MRGTYFPILIALVLTLVSCQERHNGPVSAELGLHGYRVAYWTGVRVMATIESVSLNESQPAVLAENLIVCDSTLSWSPDGAKILFTSDWRIYVVNSDGTQLKKLSSDDSKDSYAVWSPEGFRIAFQSERAGKSDIYVMRGDGGDRRQVTNSAQGARMPSWTPDGELIAYMGDGGIHIVNADGTGDHRVTDCADDFKPLWSPVGTSILFRSKRDGDNEIYLMKPDGSDQTNVSTSSANDEHHAWSPEGKEIVFVSDRDSGLDDQDRFVTRRELYTVNVDGTRLNRLTHDSYASSPTWSPDGLSIVYEDEDLAWVSNRSRFIALISAIGGDRSTLAGGFSPTWSPVKLR